jgi:hypothetical protein
MEFGGSTRTSGGRKREPLTRKRGCLQEIEELFSSGISRRIHEMTTNLCCCQSKKRRVQDGTKNCCGKEVNTERSSALVVRQGWTRTQARTLKEPSTTTKSLFTAIYLSKAI